MPAPSGSCWITVYRNMKAGNVGMTLSSERGTEGGAAHEAIVADWERVQTLLGGDAELVQFGKDARQRISEQKQFGNLNEFPVRDQAFNWLADRANTWVNVLRPLIRSEVADLAQ